MLQKMLEDMGVSLDEVGGCGLNGDFDLLAESPDGVAREEDTISCNGRNSGTPSSHRKPPANCDNNLNFL